MTPKLLILLMLYGNALCAEEGLVPLKMVLNQKDGPVGTERIIETTNVDPVIAQAIIRDVGDQIIWNWSRLVKHETRIMMFGEITKIDDNDAMCLAFIVEKANNKWTMTPNAPKRIKFSR